MTQCERLLMHLKQHGTIQPLKAWRDLGIYRLGSRIFDLREAGHKIKRNWVVVVNKWGEECRIAEYSLETEDAA